MSTRSRIAFKSSHGEIFSIYCHYDGYETGVGACLIEKYNDFVKQMQDYKEDWRKELEYTLYEDSTDFDEEERRMMPRAKLDFSQVDPSELPF